MIRKTRQLTLVTSANWVSNTIPLITAELEEQDKTAERDIIIGILHRWQTITVSPCSTGTYGDKVIDKIVINSGGYGGVIKTDSGFYPLINNHESSDCWVKFR